MRIILLALALVLTAFSTPVFAQTSAYYRGSETINVVGKPPVKRDWRKEVIVLSPKKDHISIYSIWEEPGNIAKYTVMEHQRQSDGTWKFVGAKRQDTETVQIDGDRVTSITYSQTYPNGMKVAGDLAASPTSLHVSTAVKTAKGNEVMSYVFNSTKTLTEAEYNEFQKKNKMTFVPFEVPSLTPKKPTAAAKKK